MLALLGCSARTLPPRGEGLIIIDTDVPLNFVDRLRVDVFEDGRWIESRDIARRDVADWPASFSVYTDDTTRAHRALIRIRAYPDGKMRDYLGERFVSRASGPPGESAIPSPPADGAPTLIRDGQNVTPTSEPQPYLAIDRLLLVDLVPGTRGSTRIVLRGSCLGTMADLRGVRTCVDTEATIVPVSVETLSNDMSIPKPIDKTFGAVADPPVIAPRPGEVYVPGGAFIFGNDAIAIHCTAASPNGSRSSNRSTWTSSRSRWVDGERQLQVDSPAPTRRPCSVHSNTRSTTARTSTRARPNGALGRPHREAARASPSRASAEMPPEPFARHRAAICRRKRNGSGRRNRAARRRVVAPSVDRSVKSTYPHIARSAVVLPSAAISRTARVATTSRRAES